MPGLVPGISLMWALSAEHEMAGTSPAMTQKIAGPKRRAGAQGSPLVLTQPASGYEKSLHLGVIIR